MKSKRVLKGVVLALSAVALSACNQIGIEGSWVEPVPGMPHMEQGFTLEAGGKATSINMETLQYETWSRKDDLLILTGKSIGNRQTIPFSDTLTIRKLTRDSLILEYKGMVRSYSSAGRKSVKDTVPVSVLTPAKNILSVKGDLIIGHEVRSFTANGDSLSYWTVDKTGKLMQEYDQISGGTKIAVPVYAELQVIDMGRSDEGFAADYAGVYHVVRIDTMFLR